MSDDKNAIHEHGKAAAEEDRVPAGRLFLVGVAALAIFLVASIASTAVLNRSRRIDQPEGPPPVPAEAGQRVVGLVEQVQLENQQVVEETEAPARKRLSEYGWVDRSQGRIHVPVERAMELTLQGVKP